MASQDDEGAAEEAVERYLKNWWPSDPDIVRRWRGRIAIAQTLVYRGERIAYRGFNPITGFAAINEARAGNRFADAALRNLADELKRLRAPIPSILAEYVKTTFRRPKSRPKKPTERKEAIRLAVLVARQSGLDETRNRATNGRESASSVVARALGKHGESITEAAVEKTKIEHSGPRPTFFGRRPT